MSTGRPPKTLPEWVRYLHTARAVPKGSPDYGEAQEAVRFALQRIRTLAAVAGGQDQGALEQTKPVNPPQALGLGLMHGLSLGTGEPLAGLLAALVPGGQGFAEGAQQYRQGLENIGTQQPVATPAGDVAGLALQSAVPIRQAVGAGTELAKAIPSARASALARFFTGAGQTNVTPALAIGALQGFSAGGDDPGDFKARLTHAAIGAGTAAVGAAALGGLGALRVPRWLSTTRREIREAVPKGTPPPVVEQMTESAIREGLKRQGYDVPTQDRILAAWRAGETKVPPPPPPPPPPTIRPGETITPIAPKDPLAEPTFLRRETGRGLSTQAGGAGARGVGGHSYTGTYPAGTTAGLPGRVAPSPVGGPMPSQAMQLQQAQILVQLSPAEFEAAASLFPKALIDQLRVIRGNMVGGVLP